MSPHNKCGHDFQANTSKVDHSERPGENWVSGIRLAKKDVRYWHGAVGLGSEVNVGTPSSIKSRLRLKKQMAVSGIDDTILMPQPQWRGRPGLRPLRHTTTTFPRSESVVRRTSQGDWVSVSENGNSCAVPATSLRITCTFISYSPWLTGDGAVRTSNSQLPLLAFSCF